MDFQELNFEIAQLKQNLKATDYQAIKHSEGLITDEEYKPIKTQREEWRKLINKYQEELPAAKEKYLKYLEEQMQEDDMK